MHTRTRNVLIVLMTLVPALTALAPTASAVDKAETVTTGNTVVSIAGSVATCRCCIEGPVKICRECTGNPCTCDFDIYGLPRCTGSSTDVVQ